MIGKIVLSILFYALAGLCKGVKDTLQFHYSASKFKNRNRRFWDPEVSWRNKYKNGDKKQGPRFPGSTTLFVGFTDGWHLFQLFQLACLRTSLVVLASIFWSFSDDYWTNFLAWLVIWIGLIVVHSAGFHLTYSVLLRLKEHETDHLSTD